MAAIQTRIKNGIATITLDNPPLNVFTLAMIAELDALLDELAADDAVRVLLIAGAGERAFCAGADIKEFAQYTTRAVNETSRAMDEKIRPENAMYSKLADFPKPTIAALNSHALGGGLELAVCCDLLVAADGAKIGLPEVNLGVFPGAGGTLRVTRRIGEGRAKELMLLGQPVDAATAQSWGLVNRVVAAAAVMDAAWELAEHLATLPNRAVQLCKRAISYAYDTDAAVAIERTLPLVDEAFRTDDIREGVRAFAAKEKPRFTHQ